MYMTKTDIFLQWKMKLTYNFFLQNVLKINVILKKLPRMYDEKSY